MDKEKCLEKDFSQSVVSEIWQGVWEKNSPAAEKIFTNQLFIEGYKVFKKYITQDARQILEAGGGSGRFGLKIAQNLPNSKVTIIDIVDSSLVFIKKLSENLGLKNIFVAKDDILNLSFNNNSFDLVISDAVIQHVSDDQKAIEEMVRILKPGGKLIISVVNFWNFHSVYKVWLKLTNQKYEYHSERAYTKKELRNLFELCGLKIIEEDGFYPAYGIIRLKRRYRFFKLLGRICNRFVKILDKYTDGFFSKNFGFEIVIIGEK